MISRNIIKPKSVCFSLIFTFLMFASCKPSKQVELRLNQLFNDHMVLQQKEEVAFWGTYTPNKRVTVSGSWGEESTTNVAENGNWKLKLTTPKAGGPYKVNITTNDSIIVINDVLIGEVWLASGQSNMEMPLKGWPPSDPIKNSEEEIANAQYSNIRMFDVANRFSLDKEATVKGNWTVCSSEVAGDFSASAYFFARRLNQELNVPIGIINSTWGGTPAESWVSVEGLKNLGDFDSMLEAMADPEAERNTKEWYARWKQMDIPSDTQDWDVIDLKDNDMAQPSYNDENWKTLALPGRLDWHNEQDVNGVFWFRKTVEIDDESSGYTFEMGAVDDVDAVYVNGQKIGGTVYDFTNSRSYKIPTSTLKSGKNIIAIRVVDTGGPGSISGFLRLKNTKEETITLDGDWKFLITAELFNNKIYTYDLKSVDKLQRPKIIVANAYSPTTLFNAMIHPLVDFNFKGAIWYQGESNVGRAKQYERLFPELIKDWRTHWQRDFPFYFVQIAPYNYGSPADKEGSMDLRNAQRKSLSTKNTGMVVTMDIGNFMNIHPSNKQDVGSRLAGLALANDYNKEIVASGPLYQNHTISGNKIIVEFIHIGSGLTFVDSSPKGFEIAGPDKKYISAEAVINDNKIELSAPSVEDPKYVRYAWSDNGIATLFNKEGLPASTFKTED